MILHCRQEIRDCSGLILAAYSRVVANVSSCRNVECYDVVLGLEVAAKLGLDSVTVETDNVFSVRVP